MFGIFKKDKAKSQRSSLDEKYGAIADLMVNTLNQNGVAIMDRPGAKNIARETLQKLSEQEILECNTLVASLFAMMHTADSSFRDNEEVMAKYISMQCKAIGKTIMQSPNSQYNDKEFTMVNISVDLMKKIDGHSPTNKLDLSGPSKFKESLIRSPDIKAGLMKPETWQEISKTENPRAYMEIVESLAVDGNSQCQEFVAQWNLIASIKAPDAKGVKFGLTKAIEFGEMAAQSGVAAEALNLPISIGKLLNILIEESNGSYTDEIKSLFKKFYTWSVLNSTNNLLTEEERMSAAKTARRLYEDDSKLFANT